MYRILPDENSDGYVIEVYNGSIIGWIWVKDVKSRYEAEQWVLKTVIKPQKKDLGDGTFKSRIRT